MLITLALSPPQVGFLFVNQQKLWVKILQKNLIQKSIKKKFLWNRILVPFILPGNIIYIEAIM